jgi:predicted DsbA family dithiol-disulfide isomerase
MGSIEKVWQAQNRVSMFGAELGLDFRFDQVKRIPNTFETHRLLFLASGQKQQNELAGRLYESYFRDGENVGDPAFLVQTARSLDLPEKVLHEFSQTRRAETEIRTLEQDYREAGIHAVPTYIFNQKFIVQGGQAEDVFQRVFEKVGDKG